MSENTRSPRRSVDALFHLVDVRNWASIQRCGLLSAARLVALSGQAGTDSLRRHRAIDEVLPSGVVLRDQKPMPPHSLRKCLSGGLSPEDWYELLNSKVFFWLDEARLHRHRNAYRQADQLILTIDAPRLLARYGDLASVSPINTGNARRAAAPRNATTFVPYRSWQSAGWASETIPDRPTRSLTHRPVELTIPGDVTDIMEYVSNVSSAA